MFHRKQERGIKPFSKFIIILMNFNKIIMKQITVKKRILFGLIVFFGMSSVTAQPNNKVQQTPPTFEKLLKEMDANEDGKLSADEVKGPLKKELIIIDTDEDGYISEEELEKAPKSL